MQNMLITGGCGFIGANFIRYLFNKADFKGRIVIVDKLTYAGNLENLADIETDFKDRYVFIRADICDGARMDAIFEDYKIDSICHFAAESHVDRSIVEPDAFIQTNIVGTFNLLESARARLSQIIRFHHISTDEVYGSLGRDGYFTETTPYKPNSPYSASKASSDHLVRAYYKTYGLPMTISNCSNNYGPYQFPEKLIPLMILNGLAGKSLPIYGDGRNVRDWLYVEDHCEAIWVVMQNGKMGEIYNVGGGNEMENITIVEMICDILDEINKLSDNRPRRELIAFVKDRPGHDRRYAIDFTKMQQELNWNPVTSLETGIRNTIRWYLDNRRWVERVQSGEYQDWIKTHYA